MELDAIGSAGVWGRLAGGGLIDPSGKVDR
jgi:hypothetical protein